jgi:hypothetical protein
LGDHDFTDGTDIFAVIANPVFFVKPAISNLFKAVNPNARSIKHN